MFARCTTSRSSAGWGERYRAISLLLEAASIADGHRALGEHSGSTSSRWREGFAGFVARESGRERVIAYAQISRGMVETGRRVCRHPQCDPRG